jgi:hypothetical protein
MYVNAVFMVYIRNITKEQFHDGLEVLPAVAVKMIGLLLNFFMFKLSSLNKFMFNRYHKIVTHTNIFTHLTGHPQLLSINLFAIHYKYYTLITVADRAVSGMNCLRSLERWDRGFESHSKHVYLYCVRLFCMCVVLCVGTGFATG